MKLKGKVKLLYYGDINTRTGFGQIADKLIPGLHATGNYDIVALGINNHGEPHPYPCHVYPTDSSDVYGVQLFPRVLYKERPDIVFCLQDLFVLKDLVQARDTQFPHVPIVGYFPIDGNNIPDDWAQCIVRLDTAVTYSDFGHDLVKWRIPSLSRLEMIHHGIDTNMYKILPTAERDKKRASLHWEGKFVIGVINRFQPRKMVPMVIRAFSLFRQGYKKCLGCGNYYHLTTPKCDLNYCDAGFEVHPGHEDAVLYLHMNISEPMMGGIANDLPKAFMSNQLFNLKEALFIPGIDIYSDLAPDTKEMNLIYNSCDVFVTGTIGEGFGLTGAEAMAAGLPVVCPINTTAMELFGEGRGRLVKSSTFINMPFDSGHLRPVFDIPDMVDKIAEVYGEWKLNGYVPNIAGYYWVKKNLNWADIVPRFNTVLQETLKRKAQQSNAVAMDSF
jgi:glycosyltransferase involved in cell wall biosynthesis